MFVLCIVLELFGLIWLPWWIYVLILMIEADLSQRKIGPYGTKGDEDGTDESDVDFTGADGSGDSGDARRDALAYADRVLRGGLHSGGPKRWEGSFKQK